MSVTPVSQRTHEGFKGWLHYDSTENVCLRSSEVQAVKGKQGRAIKIFDARILPSSWRGDWSRRHFFPKSWYKPKLPAALALYRSLRYTTCIALRSNSSDLKLGLISCGIGKKHLSTSVFTPEAQDSMGSTARFQENISLKPDFGPNSRLFPPLPEITSHAIRQQVFTHRSFFARPTHVFEDQLDDLSPDNEKFEHLGDTVLSLAVTSMMLKEYPGLRVGPSTKVRALIVGNVTLAEISVRYKLPDRLRLHPAQAITLRASTNIQADVFESFIGGLYLDQGLEITKAWLDRLFRPYARAAYLLVRRQHGLPPPSPMFRSNTQPAQRNSNSATGGFLQMQYGIPPPSLHSARVDTAYPASALTGSDSRYAVVAGNLMDGNTSANEPASTTASLSMTTAGHLALFNQHLQKANRVVEWKYSDCECVACSGGQDRGDVAVGAGSSDTYSATEINSSSPIDKSVQSSSPSSQPRSSSNSSALSVAVAAGGSELGSPNLSSSSGSTPPLSPSVSSGSLSPSLSSSSASFPLSQDANNIICTRGARTTPVWYVRVVVDGELYGRGRGGTKKSARNEAAKQGLRRMGVFV